MALIRSIVLLAIAAVAFTADLDDLIGRVARYQYGQEPSAVRELEARVYRAGPADAAALESRLCSLLSAPASTPAARDTAFRALSIVGGDVAVPVIAPFLLKPETVEMARYALERNPSAKASDALRQALPRVKGVAQSGILHSLGRRRDAASVPAVVTLLASADATVAAAAAGALAQIGGKQSEAALAKAKPTRAIAEALLALNPAAHAKHVYATASSDAIRIAALPHLGRAPALDALRKGSPALRAAAIRLLASDSQLLLAELPKSTPDAQVQILAALADRRTAAVLPAFTEALRSESSAVRIAALNGLAKLGGPTHVLPIATLAATTTATEQEAARAALLELRGAPVDTAILDGIAPADAKTKVELIRTAGERGIRTAVPALLKAAADPSPAVRRESIRALRETAGPSDVPAMLTQLAATRDETERDEYAGAVAGALRRSRQASVAPVVAAWRSAADPDVRLALLSVLSQVGAGDGLPVVREAMQSKDADHQRAAINAFANWPTPEPLDDLIALARTAATPTQHVLALRGYIKLVQLPVQRDPEETTRLLRAAFDVARRPDEKKAVLAALQRVFTGEALALAKSAASDPAIAAEAKTAVASIERGLSYRRK